MEKIPSVHEKKKYSEGENADLSYTYPKSQSHLQKQFHKEVSQEVSLEVIQEEANSSFYTSINLQSRDEESVYTSRAPRDSGSHSDPEDDGYSEVTYDPSVHELAALTHSDKSDNPGVSDITAEIPTEESIQSDNPSFSENPDITAEISVEKSIQSDNLGISENPDTTAEIPVDESIQSYYVNDAL